jgi:2,4-dienoyl-CoA reductase-like NADH-dependent reductase (Old Yellow Enzyme family)
MEEEPACTGKDKQMSALFEPARIGKLEVRNRFVRSATGDRCQTRTGLVADRQIALFEGLAAGGIGLIVTGLTAVHDSGRLGFYQSSIAHDNCVPGLRRLTEAVHRHGSLVAVQLFHGGRESGKNFKSKEGSAWAPSVIANDPYWERRYREIREEEIWEVINAFGDGARRAREANFDAVQVHGAHAYLLSQFLSPYSNRRVDAWGGEIANRLRIHCEVLKDIRSKVGDEYPVLIKLGVEDGFPGGLQFHEGKLAARVLADVGYDLIEVSSGLRGRNFEETEFRTGIDAPHKEGYFREWCRDIKPTVRVPVAMIGGLRTIEVMEDVIQKGEADLVGLCRPFIREPALLETFRKDRSYTPKCISCNGCLYVLRQGKPVRCVFSED